MARNKELKKSEFNSWPNCVNADPAIKGRWAEHFGNDHRIVLEIGCGKGDIAVGLAHLHPEINYIGVDIKAVRMWTGAKTAQEEGLKNVAFLRCNIHALINFFEENEVSGIWITFPDPFPKKKQTRNRLINEGFLKTYAHIMKPGGKVFFKSDNVSLFDYALEHFKELMEKEVFGIGVEAITRDLHSSELLDEETRITTDYERRFQAMGKPIQYMRFSLSPGKNVTAVPATEKIALAEDEKAPRLR